MKGFLDWLLEASMDVPSALRIFGMSKPPETEKELNALYKKLAMSRHPDHGGSTRQMQELNAAKEVLKKAIGKETFFNGKSVSAAEMKTASAERKKAIAKEMEKLFRKLDGKAYKAWFEKLFQKPFKVEVVHGTEKSLYGSFPSPMVELTASSEGSAEVFHCRMTANMFDSEMTLLQGSGLGGKDVTFSYVISADALVGGKRQAIVKSRQVSKSYASPMTDPSVVFPEARMKKLASGMVRKDSKMQKRDFNVVFVDRWGCETDGKDWWMLSFDRQATGVEWGLCIERYTLSRKGFYRIGSSFWAKDSTKRYAAWKEQAGVKIDCSFIPETKESCDFLEKAFAYAKKTKDQRKIADFIRKGSERLA